MSRRLWTQDELFLALNLYFTIPFGQYHARNPQVINLAQIIGRTPDAVAMKLVNFAALDPNHRARGIKGLQNYGNADKLAWDAFSQDWIDAAEGTEEQLEELGYYHYTPPDDRFITEVETSVKVRRGQRFFRKVILVNYERKCCVCEFPIEGMLIASHIIPWREREDLRLDPQNGLCLCTLHDKAFDSGYLGIDSEFRVIISPQIEPHRPNPLIENGLFSYNGTKVVLPGIDPPNEDYLDFHYNKYFLK
jgi:putative restriction endonuclease